MSAAFPLYAAALGIDLPGMIQRETNKAKYRAADQASYREKERQRREEYNRTHFGG